MPPPWTAWHDRLHQTLRRRQLLAKNQSVLLAVSGGQDSLCLAKLLLDLQPKWGWRLAIAHCNHRWQPDADDNATHVQQFAQSYELPFFLVTVGTPPVSEAAARTWRYAELNQIAQTQDFSTIATGHTASDRAETLLYNLIRGSGMDGLQALSWQRNLQANSNVNLIRPLLEFTRTETAQICQEFDLPIWQDSTNQDLTYARNRIRQELLPYLSQHFNPQVELTLAQTAELLRADLEFLETTALSFYAELLPSPKNLTNESEPELAEERAIAPHRLNRQSLKTMPVAIQRRVLRHFLKDCLPQAPTFADIEKLHRLVAAPHRSQTDPFVGGAIARTEGDWLIINFPNH